MTRSNETVNFRDNDIYMREYSMPTPPLITIQNKTAGLTTVDRNSKLMSP